MYRTAPSRNHKHANKRAKMRWFSSLKGKKMKAHTKMAKVEEKRRLQARGVPRSRRTRGRGVYGGKLRALAVCTASIDTLSSVGITFLLSCVFSFTFSSSRSPSKSVGNPQAQADGLRLAAWSDISGRPLCHIRRFYPSDLAREQLHARRSSRPSPRAGAICDGLAAVAVDPRASSRPARRRVNRRPGDGPGLCGK